MPFAIQSLGCFKRIKMVRSWRENIWLPLNCVYSWPWGAPISQHGPFLLTSPPWFSFCCDGLAERKSNSPGIFHFQGEMSYPARRNLTLLGCWADSQTALDCGSGGTGILCHGCSERTIQLLLWLSGGELWTGIQSLRWWPWPWLLFQFFALSPMCSFWRAGRTPAKMAHPHCLTCTCGEAPSPQKREKQWLGHGKAWGSRGSLALNQNPEWMWDVRVEWWRGQGNSYIPIL